MTDQQTFFTEEEDTKPEQEPTRRNIDHIFEALCKASNYDLQRLTKDLRGRVNEAGGTLRCKRVPNAPQTRLLVEQVLAAYQRYGPPGAKQGEVWPEYPSPQFLAKYWEYYKKLSERRLPGQPSMSEMAERDREEEWWRNVAALDALFNEWSSRQPERIVALSKADRYWMFLHVVGTADKLPVGLVPLAQKHYKVQLKEREGKRFDDHPELVALSKEAVL